ncbi:MAG: sugar phosphate isomerase/epimerase [Clostridia bacterium]|nr:sugar phosphate isomerase/epimerase [Clostridia bacterium]
MYKLKLGTSISTVKPLGFKDGNYRYGIVPELDSHLKTLKKLEFESVDVDCCYLYLPSDFATYNEGYELIKSNSIRLNAIHMPITNEWADLACQYEEDRKEIVKLFVKLIKELDKYNPSAFVFHPGGFGVNQSNYEEYTKRLIKSVNVLTQETDKKICIENMAGKYFLDTSDKMLDFLSNCKDAYTCVDVNHFYYEKPEDAILKYGDRIGTIHVSDYDFIKERHLLPKQGQIEWNKVIGALKKVNYNGIFNYEVLSKFSPEQIKQNYLELFNDFNEE